MQGKDKVKAEDFRKTIPDATMGWVLMQPFVKPFFVRDDEGVLCLKSHGRTTRYYAIDSADQAKVLAKRTFRYAVPIVLLMFSTWIVLDVALVALPILWKLLLPIVPALLGYACWSFARWRISRGLPPHHGGSYRTVTDAEFRDILRGRLPEPDRQVP